MNDDETNLYRDALDSQKGKTDSTVLREMAAAAAVRQHQMEGLQIRVSRLEGEMAFFKQLVQRGRGALWMMAALFGLGMAVVYSREKIAEALAWVSQGLGGKQ